MDKVFKFPGSKNIKVTFTQISMAVKATQKGILLFNLSICPRQIVQDKYISITTCYTCYKIEDHLSKNCPDKDLKICSECGNHGHIWKECNSPTKGCINCHGAHRTTAMACPKRKEAIKNKRNILEKQTEVTTRKSFADAAQPKSTPEMSQVEPVTMQKMMLCMMYAHSVNMANPGTFNKELNNVLKMNNLPSIKTPSNPPTPVLTNFSAPNIPTSPVTMKTTQKNATEIEELRVNASMTEEEQRKDTESENENDDESEDENTTSEEESEVQNTKVKVIHIRKQHFTQAPHLTSTSTSDCTSTDLMQKEITTNMHENITTDNETQPKNIKEGSKVPANTRKTNRSRRTNTQTTTQ